MSAGRYFGTATAGTGAPMSTGLTDQTIIVEAGNHDAAVRVMLHPDGRYEIEIVDVFGARVGHLVPPKPGVRGRRVITGRLPEQEKS